MKIVVENAVWANIGNGWYQTSLMNLIKNLYPEHRVYMGEGPARVSFRITKEKQLKNAFNLIEYEEADIHVYSGPILFSFVEDYSEAIKKLIARGENYALISVSGTHIPSSKVIEIGDFLKKYPPVFMSTRDEETYNTFKQYVPNSYNGICTSFLVDQTIPLNTLQYETPYFISSFYRELEPYYSILSGMKCSVENLQIKHNRKFMGLPYSIGRHFNSLVHQQSEVGNMMIVRPVQGLSTKFNHINFAMPNSFISFNPISYLELTKSAQFVISDRVHACAIGLACNKPVRFTFETPRAGIFDRMGFDYKDNGGIMYPNMDRIIDEMGKLENEIKKYI